METGICQVSVAPVRRSASDKSEMVTQLLFGETLEILEKKGTWRKIRCSWDRYEGWTDHKLLRPITQEEYDAAAQAPTYSLELAQAVMAGSHFLPVLMGASLPQYDGMQLQLGREAYTFSGQVICPDEQRPGLEVLLKIARKYLNAPYLWGGRSPFGIDCSGFSQHVFRMVGVRLLRDASQQVTQGRLVDFVEQAKAGDLAFFENKAHRIAHVGIVLPEGKIIHAHGRVRLDKLDHFGIFNEETSRYTHRLRVIKRVLPDDLVNRISEPAKAGAANPIGHNQMGLFS
jgi:cell wall-associated NlpC family hydrolase